MFHEVIETNISAPTKNPKENLPDTLCFRQALLHLSFKPKHVTTPKMLPGNRYFSKV